MAVTPQTRTDGTEQAYLARATQLIKSVPGGWSGDVAGWLVGVVPRLRVRTVRQYRAALAFALDSRGLSVEAARVRSVEPRAGDRRLPLRTSAKKAKSLSREDQDRLEQALRESGTERAMLAAGWLAAATASGIRPVEWADADLSPTPGGGWALRVRNRKATNDRSHGEFRTINFDAGCEGIAVAIAGHINRVEEYRARGASIEDLENRARKAIHYYVRKLWPGRAKHPSLYTPRHQFSANAKREGKGKSEVAALLGHGSDRTAGVHYGKGKHGDRRTGVKASPDEVKRVRESGGRARPEETAVPSMGAR